MNYWLKPIRSSNVLSWILAFNRFGGSCGIRSELLVAFGDNEKDKCGTRTPLFEFTVFLTISEARGSSSWLWAVLSLHQAPGLIGFPVSSPFVWKPQPLILSPDSMLRTAGDLVCSFPFVWNLSPNSTLGTAMATVVPHLFGIRLLSSIAEVCWFSAFPQSKVPQELLVATSWSRTGSNLSWTGSSKDYC